jgi:hypothetical protein
MVTRDQGNLASPRPVLNDDRVLLDSHVNTGVVDFDDDESLVRHNPD